MIVCFDIGGSTIKGAVATSPHHVRAMSRSPTPRDDFDAFVAALKVGIDEAGGRPEAVALSITGNLDAKTRRITVANIPCLLGRHLGADLQEALDLPVVIANDADCFVLAEATVGAGRGHDVVFGAIMGTGIGGGLVVNGRLLSSAGGHVGEWGHGPVAQRQLDCLPEPLPAFACGCGLKGCLDATCSARGIERLHRHINGAALPSTEILRLWHQGDAGAVLTVTAWLEILSPPLAMVINTSGATVVPVGGGLSNDAALVAALDSATRPLTMAKPESPMVVPAECHTEPGLIGAAILTLQHGQAALVR